MDCQSANRADYVDCGREATGEDPEAGVCDYPFSCPIGRAGKCALVPGSAGAAENELDMAPWDPGEVDDQPQFRRRAERGTDYEEYGPAGADVDVDDWRARERV